MRLNEASRRESPITKVEEADSASGFLERLSEPVIAVRGLISG